VIVRILGEGQFDVPDADLERLNAIDDELIAAVDAEDETAFRAALDALLSAVREHATPHALETLDSSDLVLPAPDATLAEVRDLLGEEGLIPS
jgi:hypothetical protein